MMDESPDPIYKSPLKKLVRFFEHSRDRWKAKSQTAKATVKRLQNRVRFLERSKADLKVQIQTLEAEVARLKSHERTLEQTVERLQKKGRSTPPAEPG